MTSNQEQRKAIYHLENDIIKIFPYEFINGGVSIPISIRSANKAKTVYLDIRNVGKQVINKFTDMINNTRRIYRVKDFIALLNNNDEFTEMNTQAISYDELLDYKFKNPSFKLLHDPFSPLNGRVVPSLLTSTNEPYYELKHYRAHTNPGKPDYIPFPDNYKYPIPKLNAKKRII